MALKKISFEQACEKTGSDPLKILPYKNPKNNDGKAYNILRMLEEIITAYNMVRGKKWVPKYSDDNQAKWRIWFIWDASLSVFRFDGTNIGFTFSVTGAGSRHACRTDEIAEFVGREYIEEWNLWLTR